MTTSENPYLRLPTGFDPRKFFGSMHWVRFVLEEVSATPPRDLELIGLPGMAKSTLLHYLAHPDGAFAQHPEWLQGPFRAAPAQLFPILVEFRQEPTEIHPFTYLARRFYEEYVTYHERQAPGQAVPLPYPQALGPVERDTPEGSVDALEGAIRTVAESCIRPVFLLDDFDLAFERLSYEQATRLRPWRDQVAFVLVTERALHEVNPRAIGSPFFQTLPLIRLGGLSEPEARRLLAEPAEQAGHPFPDADLDYVLELTDGHPYLLILAGRALWETRERLGLLAQPDQPLPLAPRRVLRGRLQDDFRRTFQVYYDRLEPNEQQALRALLAGEAEALPDMDYVALASLEQKGLVRYDLDGAYALFSPLFADFLPGVGDPAPARNEPSLNGLEATLYTYLRAHQDRVCTFEELWRDVWGDSGPADAEAVAGMRRRTQVTVSRLRKRLQESTGEDITSVRDQGYRLIPRRD